jgi:TrmH RNA methyltransferase
MTTTKKNQESRIYGRHACLKIYEKRPSDIVRAYVTQDGLFEFKGMLKTLADLRVPYHVVDKEEIDSITKATHHENVCLIVKKKKLPEVKDLLTLKGRSLILCLEEVENPHNLGAILRSAAHYGVRAIFYQAKVPVANSAAAIRTAEGGAETIPALQITDWSYVFDLGKRSGFEFMATSSHQGNNLFDVDFPDKVLLFLGAEGRGMSEKMLKKIDLLLSIPGTGEVESLNVSHATAAILTEWYRQGLPNANPRIIV